MVVPFTAGSTEAIGAKCLAQGHMPRRRFELTTLCLQDQWSNHYTTASRSGALPTVFGVTVRFIV